MQFKTWRSNKKNEVSIHLNSVCNNEAFAWGISYERTVYKRKNKLNGYLSLHSSIFVRANNFYENFSEFISSRNQSQIFCLYNLGYRKIVSLGLGSIFVGERFYPNPAALMSYKFDLPKAKATLGMQLQVSLNSRVPPKKFTQPPLPTSVGGFNKPVYDILKNWSGGISIGKYF